MTLTSGLRSEVAKRSRYRCEAFIQTPSDLFRCPQRASEIHHLLTRARGGDALDQHGEIYHLIHLCHQCHAESDGGKAYVGGMLIEGSVRWDHMMQRPVYTGPDDYLKEMYGPK